MIDAVYWAEMMYQGVHEEQRKYEEFSRKSKEERERKHDRIRSDQEKWEDPWLRFLGSMMIVNGGTPSIK